MYTGSVGDEILQWWLSPDGHVFVHSLPFQNMFQCMCDALALMQLLIYRCSLDDAATLQLLDCRIGFWESPLTMPLQTS